LIGKPTWKTFSTAVVVGRFDETPASIFVQWPVRLSPIMLTRLAASSRPLTRGLTRPLPSKAYTDILKRENSAVQSTPGDLSPSERNVLESALRVDQAGEIAANYIYRGQIAVLGRDRQVGKLIQVCFVNVSQLPTDSKYVGHVGARKETPRRDG
jgi:hypothetical protein